MISATLSLNTEVNVEQMPRLSGFKSLYAVAVMWSAITRGVVSVTADYATYENSFTHILSMS